ncbi:Uncharacterized protein APZ42_007349, partial [Daphnia magna]
GNHASQTTYCTDHNMKLLTLESYEKEQAIYAAWGTQDWFWTSITDSLKKDIGFGKVQAQICILGMRIGV